MKNDRFLFNSLLFSYKIHEYILDIESLDTEKVLQLRMNSQAIT